LSLIHNLAEWAPMGLPAFLFVITIVVFFHELGHFSVARACGVKVETFSIGFGPAIVSWLDRKGTRWKISWVPLGGYVKFLGDADAAGTPDREAVEKLPSTERQRAFPFKPLYQRAAIVAAGPFANFILAIVIFSCVFLIFGRVSDPPVIESIMSGSAAQQAGLKPGDVIRAVDGRTISDFVDLQEATLSSGGRTLSLTLDRKGRSLSLTATPRLTARKDSAGDTEKVYALGISIDVPPIIASVSHGSTAERIGLMTGDIVRAVDVEPVTGFEQFAALVASKAGKKIAIKVQRGHQTLTLKTTGTTKISTPASGKDEAIEILGALSLKHPKPVMVHYNPITAVAAGVDQTWTIATGTLGYVWQMVVGHADMGQLRGPIGVAGVAKKIAALGIFPLIQLAALMSVSIGLINLFPIPLLDGGHLLYYGCEAVLGRPLGERTQDVGFRLGLAVVLGLMILVFWNDLARLNLF
jgi:regulator of sigma E protease